MHGDRARQWIRRGGGVGGNCLTTRKMSSYSPRSSQLHMVCFFDGSIRERKEEGGASVRLLFFF